MSRIQASQQVSRWQRTSGVLSLALPFLLLPALAARLIYINVVDRDELLELVHEQQAGESVIPAQRGRILDRRERILALTRDRPDVFIDPKMISDMDDVAGQLAARLNMQEADLLAAIERRPDSRFVVLARSVDLVTADAIRELGIRGVGLVNRPRRVYPLEDSLAHVLGFVGSDGTGLEGVELAFDAHLAGEDGRLSSIRDARRRAMFAENGSRRDPVDGGDVILTIDAEIQRIVESALQAQIEAFTAESGVAIAMSPVSGEVLAMACAPSFVVNEAARYPADIRRNRALTDPVEPGSTFKPFIAGGALQAGVIDLDDEIDCHMGSHYFGKRLVKDSHPYGILDITGIITKSSNIAMAQIADLMGNALLHDTIRSFGFGARTGIELPGESSGVVYDLARWDSYSTTSVSFGYEVGVTPIQLIAAFCALINDGVLVPPKIVKQLRRADGIIVTPEDHRVTFQTVAPDIARYLTQTAMVSVVKHGGSGKHLKGPYQVLGKTGTAKLLAADRRGYEPGSYLSTFMGAAPVDDPQLAVVVMIRRPDATRGYYGATVAAPAVGEIIRTTLPYMGVPPDDIEHETVDEGRTKDKVDQATGINRQVRGTDADTADAVVLTHPGTPH